MHLLGALDGDLWQEDFFYMAVAFLLHSAIKTRAWCPVSLVTKKTLLSVAIDVRHSDGHDKDPLKLDAFSYSFLLRIVRVKKRRR